MSCSNFLTLLPIIAVPMVRCVQHSNRRGGKARWKQFRALFTSRHGARAREPVLIDTGLQRLVRDLDELPGEEMALDLLEPPHRGAGLSPKPLDPTRVGRHARIVSLLVTQGCKFNCSYCPIPAVNQKSWRYRSPEALVRTISTIYERFHIKYFFGADDNFFNRRETAEALLTAMARSTAAGAPFRERIRFATEATQFDTFRNRDLLPASSRRWRACAMVWH